MKDPLRSLRAARRKIDAIDRQLVRLLQGRAREALVTAEAKRAMGLPICDPEREAEILDSVSRDPRGPLPGESLRRVYRLIIREIRAAERKSHPPQRKRKG